MTVYTVDFFGTKITTTLTARSSVVEEWIRATVADYRPYRDRLIVGLGVQWLPPSFSGEYTPADTLQLCVGRRCLIFQLGHSDKVPNLLREFLVHPMNTFVGVWNYKDAAKLLESKHELVVKELVDIRHFVLSRYGESLVQATFEEIVRECLGYEGVGLEGSISASRWDSYRLSDAQIRQACLDAHVSFEIGKRIEAWQFLVPNMCCVSQGHLHCFSPHFNGVLMAVLKDYGHNGIWQVKHHIKWDVIRTKAFALHPFDSGILYVSRKNHIFPYDTRSHSLELIVDSASIVSERGFDLHGPAPICATIVAAISSSAFTGSLLI